MLVLGFLINTIVLAIPYDLGLRNIYVRDCVLVVFSFVCGVVSAFIRNYCAPKLEKYLTKSFRRKTISESFWYNILDDPRKPVWLRLTNLEKKYNLDGVLLELSEDKENPYVLLGYSQKYDLEGNPMVDDNVNSMDGKCMQAEPLVTDTHFVRIQLHVLQHGRSVCRECKVPFDNTRFVFRSRNLFRGQPFQPDKSAVVNDTFKLSHRFHETLHRFLVPYLLRNQKTTAERIPVTLLPGTLFGGLGEEQVAGVVQVGTFVEVAFKTAGEKAEFVPVDVRLVFLRDENILFVQD